MLHRLTNTLWINPDQIACVELTKDPAGGEATASRLWFLGRADPVLLGGQETANLLALIGGGGAPS